MFCPRKWPLVKTSRSTYTKTTNSTRLIIKGFGNREKKREPSTEEKGQKYWPVTAIKNPDSCCLLQSLHFPEDCHALTTSGTFTTKWRRFLRHIVARPSKVSGTKDYIPNERTKMIGMYKGQAFMSPVTASYLTPVTYMWKLYCCVEYGHGQSRLFHLFH